VDYFLLLPQDGYFETPEVENFDIEKARRKILSGRGVIVDQENDYILIPRNESAGTMIVTVFRHTRREVVAVWDGGYDPAIPHLDILMYVGKHWRHVEREILPKRAYSDLYRMQSTPEAQRYEFQPSLVFRLPRYGSTIRVVNRVGATKYRLLWKQGRFVIDD
jgi:hypothetical protein